MNMLSHRVLHRLIAVTFDGAGRVLRPFGLACFFTASRLWHGDGAGWFAWTRTDSGVVVALGRGEMVFGRR